MVILITGSASPVARHLVSMLLKEYDKRDMQALIHTTVPKYLEEFDIPTVKGDITTAKGLSFYSKDIETVFHIAGETRDVSGEQYYKVNYEGTKHLLDQVVKYETKHFILLSSVGVYGFKLPSRPIPEDYPAKPTHPYNHSKWLAEKITFNYAQEHGFFASAIRPPFIIGPYDRRATVAFFDFVESSNKIPLIAKGKAILSFAHNKDVARGLYLAFKSEQANGEAFNLVSFTATLKEFLDKIAEVSGKEVRYIKMSYGLTYIFALLAELQSKITGKPAKINRRRLNQVGRTRIYDTSKIERMLGFKPEFDLLGALEDILAWKKKK